MNNDSQNKSEGIDTATQQEIALENAEEFIKSLEKELDDAFAENERLSGKLERARKSQLTSLAIAVVLLLWLVASRSHVILSEVSK